MPQMFRRHLAFGLLVLGSLLPVAAEWPKARFSEVCRAADHEVLAFAAAVGNSDCAELSRAIDTGEGDGTNGMRPCGRSDRLD